MQKPVRVRGRAFPFGESVVGTQKTDRTQRTSQAMSWNRSDGTATGGPPITRRGQSPARTRRTADARRVGARLAIALAAALAGAGAWWWATHGRGDSAVAPQASRPSSASRPKASSSSAAANVSAADRAECLALPSSADDSLPPHKRIVEMVSVVTNADGSVLERFRTADGKLRSRQSAPRPVFDNASDQILAMAVSGASSGGSMPPMPLMTDADEAFTKSLDKDIVINDNDSDAVKALKRDVMTIREEVRQIMADGYSFADVMKSHRDMVNRSVEMRKEAGRIVSELVASGDMDFAQECRVKLNAALAEAGIEGIEMPISREERRATIRKRNAGDR